LLEIPDCVTGWKSIIDFECKRNQITHISRSVGTFSSLRRISWSGNNIESLPSEIGLLKELLHINLQENAIQTLPVEMGALTKVLTIDLSHNSLRSLPHEFCLMKSLSWLDISHNSLKELPAAFGGLSNLAVLKMSHNNVQEFPTTFQNLSNLGELEAASNEISRFHRDLCHGLSSLVRLDLDRNHIELLPAEMALMPLLRRATLRRNRLAAVPPNLTGSRLQLDVGQNPLGSLPFRFTSALANRTRYRNPSGYTDAEVALWMEEENEFHSAAVEEWEENGPRHLARELGLGDFVRGLAQRRRGGDGGTAGPEDDGGREGDDGVAGGGAIGRFYFRCRRDGRPPALEDRGEVEREMGRVDGDAEGRLRRVREERADEARRIDLEQRAADEEQYVGRLGERCRDAEGRLERADAERERIERIERRAFLSDIRERIVDREDAAAKDGAIARLESNIEARRLRALSFKSHTNRERCLPLEIKACWKSTERS